MNDYDAYIKIKLTTNTLQKQRQVDWIRIQNEELYYKYLNSKYLTYLTYLT